MVPSTAMSPAFHERLMPGAGVLVTALGIGLLAVITLFPLQPVVAAVVGVAVAAAGATWLVLGAPVLAVRDGVLYAGRAHVPLEVMGQTVVLATREAMREELRGRLDARAYVVLRSWIPTGVRVAVSDPADPTPYWLLSTRRPHELAAVLRAATDAGAKTDEAGPDTTGPGTARAVTPEV